MALKMLMVAILSLCIFIPSTKVAALANAPAPSPAIAPANAPGPSAAENFSVVYNLSWPPQDRKYF